MSTVAYLIIGCAAAVIAWVLTWALLASRPARIEFMSQLTEPPRSHIANLSATLCLFPAMFALGSLRNIAAAFGERIGVVEGLLAIIQILAAIHLGLAALQFRRWVVSRASLA